jgi:hypothetical protein
LILTVDPHPLAEVYAFVTTFPRPLAEGWEALELPTLLTVPPPSFGPEDPKEAVRAMLRAGGFKPAGRSKPASEYVQAAIPESRLGAINAAVDACNVASYRGGLPISVVDLDRTREPYRVAVAPAGTRYVFNASGQELDLGGLLALWDAEGPCANAVKDSQRTKTHAGTLRTLSVVWGTRALPGRAAALGAWYERLLVDAGAETSALESG